MEAFGKRCEHGSELRGAGSENSAAPCHEGRFSDGLALREIVRSQYVKRDLELGARFGLAQIEQAVEVRVVAIQRARQEVSDGQRLASYEALELGDRGGAFGAEIDR
ncbi:MAG: hypothetical protein QOG06_2497 [Gaiellaceae bacterium]|jgi:hypothetical protein|nr:hypothetical protein [Gaiellaceae bacterium]